MSRKALQQLGLPLGAAGGALVAWVIAPMALESPPLSRREVALLALTAWMGLAALVVLRTRRSAPVELKELRTELLASLCHELRTPLTAIRGYAEMLLEDRRTPGERADLHRILRAEASLTRLVSDVLDLQTREQPLRVRPVSVHDIVLETIHRCRREGLQRRVDLELTGAPVVQADRERVVRVLTSLMATAFHADESGPIRVVVRSEPHRFDVELHDGCGRPSPTELATASVPPEIPRAGHRRGLPLAIAASNLRAMGGELVVGRKANEAPLGFHLPIRGQELTWSPEPVERSAVPTAH